MLLLDTMNGMRVEHAPAVPKIWLDLAAKLTGRAPDCFFQDPALATRTVIEAAMKCRADGARLFLFPSREVEYRGGTCSQVRAGRRLGRVDMAGGWATQLDDPADFDFDDPGMTIPYQLFKCHKPIITALEDVRKYRIPSLQEYHALYDEDVLGAMRLGEGALDVIGDCNSGTLAFCASLLGMSETMYALYDEPELLHALMEKGISLCVQQARFFLENGVTILRYNDSVANMNLISPATWRAFVFPHIKRFCEEVHALDARAKIYCHICGNVMPIIDDLILGGLDCIAPLDPLGGVSVSEIRRRVGDQFMLMGGVNTLSFIDKSPEEICREAQDVIRQGFCGGHFAVGSGCVVPRGASLEAILALHEASASASEDCGEAR